MTPEERDRYDRIDRVLEFLARNQAQRFTEFDKWKEIHVQRFAELDKLSAELNELKEVTAMHSAQIEAHGKQIEAQGKQIGELGNFALRLGHVVEEQVAAQARTDKRLNTLITVVERYFSNGRK